MNQPAMGHVAMTRRPGNFENLPFFLILVVYSSAHDPIYSGQLCIVFERRQAAVRSPFLIIGRNGSLSCCKR